MARVRSQVSVVRIAGALLVVAAFVVTVGGTFAAGMVSGMRRQQANEWKRETGAASWNTTLARFALLDELEPYGVLEHRDGNAVPLYWPDGVNASASPCGRVSVGTWDGPNWDRLPVWREVARCDRIESFVEAAHMSHMDLTDWLAGLDPAAAPGSETWFGIHQGPWGDMQATLARAHARIADGDLGGGEADARAVVSAGLHFMRGTTDVSGMTLMSITVGDALDHLREIAERRGDLKEAATIEAAANELGELRTAVWRLSDSTIKAASLEEQMHYAARLALDRAAPLGLRVHAAIMVGYGGFFHATEAALGPSPVRQRLLDEMRADPVLTVAVARGLEPYGKNLRERLDLYAMTLGMF